MKKIRDVTVYTVGDSSDIRTWSNVPYFFTETLKKKGIQVNRVNLAPPAPVVFVGRVLWKFIGLFYRNRSYTELRSLPYFLLARWKIRKALRQYPAAEADIFITFSFSSVGMSQRPIIQFCDWTFDYQVRHFERREPDRLEQGCIRREDAQIEGSNLVVSLFPGVAKYMQGRYRNENILYLGNVVNASLQANAEQSIALKVGSQSIVFIGKEKYQAGAQALIAAFRMMRAQFPALSVDIIGMKASDFAEIPEGVRCHGVLDKGNAAEGDLFYSILSRARMFVNTTPNWGGFSASLEAMYFYTPVVVTPYGEFLETFGPEINFGRYCSDASVETLCAQIESILVHPSYDALCLRAHEAVRDFTWDAYTDKFLEAIVSRGLLERRDS